ncbi:MAG: hypothetical protein LBK08_07445 [Treponema sp.]|nr:hypothetical protein [Treponema sp.]
MKRNYTESYKWKWVCVQHPMILISRDMTEPRALETVPPWGGESIYGYSVKMRDMLQKLSDTPELKIDFDLSAKELLLFFDSIPEGKKLMLDLIKQGRLGFVGCDYSQSHYGTARSESALRQLRMGAKVFREELGITADTFQHQETGLFENLPQLLSAFGIKKSAIHTFSSAFEFLEAPALEICSNFGRLELVRNETIARWRGLDGTCIPIYLPIVQSHLGIGEEVHDVFGRYCRPEFKGLSGGEKSPKAFHMYPTDYEENRGLNRNGSIIVQCPDLISIDNDYIADRKQVGTFWLLSEAIDEEMKTATRMPKIRYYTYWSYAEGEFGEMVFKKYRSGEEKILAAETMQILASRAGNKAGAFDSGKAWDKLLTAQHHDVNWIDTKELKEWAIGGIEEAEKSANEYIKKSSDSMCGLRDHGHYITVFNTLPVERSVSASIPVADGKNYDVFDGGRKIDSQMDNGTLVFNDCVKGLGYRSYELREKVSGLPAEAEVYTEPYVFHNDVMSVTVLPDGRIGSIYSKLTGERLRGAGNLLKGKLIRDDETEKWITNENASDSMSVQKGNLYDKVSVKGMIEDIPYALIIKLPHGHGQKIDFDLDLSFNMHEIGDFYHDESKLNIYWETNQRKPEIIMDEPFGWIQQRSDRPLIAANFVGLFENETGLVFQHTGTPKSWVSGSTFANLIAWGGKNFTNRSPWGWSTFDIFDMRLDRPCHYNYSVSIAENQNIAAVAGRISSSITPLITARCGSPVVPTSLLTLKNDNLIVTAVEQKDDVIAVRMYDVSGKASTPEFETSLQFIKKTDVAGHESGTIDVRAFEVFELIFR